MTKTDISCLSDNLACSRSYLAYQNHKDGTELQSTRVNTNGLWSSLTCIITFTRGVG